MRQTITHIKHRLAIVAGLAILITGCQASDPLAQWDNPGLAQRLQQISEQGLSDESRWQATQAPVDDTTVQGLVEASLISNPEIVAGRRRIERLRERIPQANALDDPRVAVTAGDLAQTAAGQVDYIVSFTQALPYPGTLDARAAVAEQEVLTATAELLDSMQHVAAEVRSLYWRRYAVARAVEVTEQDKQILGQIAEVIQARARVGSADQADQLRVALRLAELEQQLDRLHQEQRSLDAMINRLLNRDVTIPLPEPVAAKWTDSPTDREQALRDAEVRNPAVMIQRRRVEGYRHRFKLAQTERQPDLSMGVQYAGVGSDGLSPVANGDDQWGFTVGVSLPFWSDRYDAMEREALHGIGETLAQLDAAQGRAANLVEDALARMDAERSMLRRYNEQMLPDARRTLDLSLAGYAAGTESFIQMMDDWQRTLDLELATHRAHARYEQALSDLQAATGFDVAGQPAEHPTGANDE